MRVEVAAGDRRLAAAYPAAGLRGDVLTVVIEGDGAAHDRHGRPTADPTPRRPTGLAIARAWPGPAAWVGRLCQHVRDPRCAPADWTGARFSEAAVAATGAAVDRLKHDAGARRVRLVGWSGGGVIAARLAAGRTDVEALVTIAAPLDLAAWTAWHRLTPLPAGDDPGRLGRLAVPQLHLFGSLDTVSPASVLAPAAERLSGAPATVWRQRHACCWARRAAEIARLSSAGTPPPRP